MSHNIDSLNSKNIVIMIYVMNILLINYLILISVMIVYLLIILKQFKPLLK